MAVRLLVCPICGFGENSTHARFCGMCAQQLPLVCGRCGTINPTRFRFCAICYAPLLGSASSGNPSAPMIWELRPPRSRAPFVGRDTVLQELEGATLLLDHGLGGVIGVMGEMGVGVSRLTEELLARVSARSLRIVQTACFSFAQRRPYGPFVHLIQTMADVQPNDSPQLTREKLALLAQTYPSSDIPNLELYLQAMVSLELLEPEESIAIRHLEPIQLKRQILFALRELLRAMSLDCPLLVVMTDLHWADSLTIDALEYLVDGGEEIRLQWLLTMRTPLPSVVETLIDSLMIKAAHRGVLTRLERLPPEIMRDIVSMRLGVAPNDSTEAIIRISSGLPLHAEELFRYATAIGIDLQSTDPALLDQFPPTLPMLIKARFERLSSPLQTTLMVAATMGLQVWKPILELIDAGPDLLDRLQTLHADGWLEPSEIADYWRFSHSLMQEIIYTLLPGEQRQVIHSAIGLTLEQVAHERLSEHVEALAYHFSHSTYTGKAAFYGLCAAERAINRCASDDALLHYAEVEAVLTDSSQPLDHEAAEVALGRARVLAERKRFSEALTACRMGLEAVRRLTLPDPPLHAALERQMALINKQQSRFRDAQEHFAAAREVLGDGDLFDHALLDADAGLAALQAGNLQQAERFLRTALAVAETQKHLGLQMRVLNRLALLHRQQGDMNQAALLLSRRLLLGRRLNDLDSVAQTLNSLGELALERSDWADAQAYYRESTDVFATLGDIPKQIQSSLFEAQALMMLGGLDRALRVLRMAYTLARQLGDIPLMVQACVQKARISFLAGDTKRARHRLIEASALVWPLKLPLIKSEIAGLLARIAWDDGRLEIARCLANRAIRLAEDPQSLASIHASLLDAFLSIHMNDPATAGQVLETLTAQALPPYELAQWWLLSAQVQRLNDKRVEADQAEQTAVGLFEVNQISPLLRRF